MGLTDQLAEIGVRDGIYAKTLINGSECRKLHLIDPWQDLDNWNADRPFDPDSFRRAQKRMEPFGNRIAWHQCLSVQAVSEFPDESLDFVYIDADHDYDQVALDISLWWRTIQPRGILAGHDIFSIKWPGVTQAVLEHCQREGRTAYIVPGDTNADGKLIVDHSWYIFKEE